MFYNGRMPVDVSQLIQQLSRMTAQAGTAREWRETRIAELRRVFEAGHDATFIAAAQATIDNLPGNRWSSAVFDAGEPLNQWHAVARDAEPEQYALVATDGSQIMADRHKAVLYAAIQIAGICIVYGAASSSVAVQKAVKETEQKPLRILGEDELYDEITGELIPPGDISNERDLLEIELLATLCERFRAADLQPIAVADGSLVPFSLLNEPFVRNNPGRAAAQLERVSRALDRMRRSEAIVAGYIDRPNSNTIARACALADLTADVLGDEARLTSALSKLGQNMRGITDRALLEDLLPYDYRTALFKPAWLINSPAYLGQAGHTMYGCYLVVGPREKTIIRLEVPVWCASPDRVEVIASAMLRHTHMGGGYPLCLKAAHEEAVLTHADEQAIDRAMQRSLVEQGIVTRPSSKQEAKERR